MTTKAELNKILGECGARNQDIINKHWEDQVATASKAGTPKQIGELIGLSLQLSMLYTQKMFQDVLEELLVDTDKL